jgi:hypothetical protein
MKRWTAEDDAYLLERAGYDPAHVIGAHLGRRNGSIIFRASKLGISLYRRELTPQEFAARLSVNADTVRLWIETGFLKGRSWGSAWTVITEDEIERFVRECGWLFTPSRIKDRALRILSETANRRDPWLPAHEVRRLTGLDDRSFRRAVRRGYVPTRTRPSRGPLSRHYVRASDIPAVRERVTAYIAEARRRRMQILAEGRQLLMQRRAA